MTTHGAAAAVALLVAVAQGIQDEDDREDEE